MEIQIVLTTDDPFWARLARRLGGARWTHAPLRFEVMLRKAISQGLEEEVNAIITCLGAG